MTRRSRFASVLLPLSIFVLGEYLIAQQPSLPAALDGFDGWMEKTRATFQVPGAGVAIVKDGKVLLCKGYGLRDVEGGLTVTPKTLFAIGSITKSFNVAAMGTLVDEGKLDWDRPVREYLPEFRLYDSVATEQVTLRDLLSHRTGLPRHDLLWYTSDFEKAELVSRLRYLEPSQPLRTRFQYNNLMFMTAGYIEEQILHKPWETIIHDRLLVPLRMNGTNFSVLDSQKAPDFARGYRKDRKTQKVSLVPFYVQHGVGPAGEINSSVEDMSHYLLFHLDKGRFEGKQLVSENNIRQMQTSQIAIPGDPEFKEMGTATYGMGLVVTTYRGRKMVWHNGGIDGFTAQFAFLPDEGIGVVVLNNLESALPEVVAYNVMDRLLGMDQVAWPDRFLEREKKGDVAELEAEKSGYTGQKKGTHPSHEPEAYVGDYANPGYGIVSIRPAVSGAAAAFTLTLNRFTRDLRHFHYDIFEVPANPLDPIEKLKVSFQTDLKGDISSLSIPLEPSVKEIVFTRVAEKQMGERSFLAPFTGDWDFGGATRTIALEGDHVLILTAPGQPRQVLVPNHGTLFDLKDLPGQSIEFKIDKEGKVNELVYYTPDTTLVFKRK